VGRSNTSATPSRSLGPERLQVSAIGLGCWGMSRVYGPADDVASVAVLHRALDLGVTFLDTAMSYGRGHNEELLSRVLATRRDEIILATKFGIVHDQEGPRVDGRPEHVRGYCEASLRRLNVDFIDLYFQHRVDPGVPIEETVGAMTELVAEGKVGHLGVSEASADELARAAAVHPIAAMQCEWSLWWRAAEDDVIPAARRLGVGIVPYSPLGRGFLAGTIDTDRLTSDDLRHSDPRFGGEAAARNRRLVDQLGRIAEEWGATPAQVALAWLLAQGHDVVPIPGTKSIDRLEENSAAVELVLSPADVDRLERLAPRQAWAGDRAAFAGRQIARNRRGAPDPPHDSSPGPSG
jgi:aryl-alcohol dehydrogenase-like predicted oxidoreductase